MKNFSDLLPEEREPQSEELITLLKRAYRKPDSLSSELQAQVLERVRKRLMKTELEDSPIEDILLPQEGVMDSTPHKAVSRVGVHRRDRRRLRLISLLAAALVITVVLSTSLIFFRSLLTLTGSSSETPSGLPTLTLSSNTAKAGDTVTVMLKHFTPKKSVVLTHDIQEPIKINGSSTVKTDAQGTASVPLVIDKNWGPGYHLVVVEDVDTRNTASATLQITGLGPTSPPVLFFETTSIKMGAEIVGSNTIRAFTLSNGGGGSITWSASSDQPWLLVSPSQGIFSQQQTISLAVQRVGLKAGDYNGSITISTNVGMPQHIGVTMTVRPVPPNAGPVLALSPALLSFTTANGDAHESVQQLTITNPGSRPLSWALDPLQGLACNWLSAAPTGGTVAPGATSTLNIVVLSQCLLPGTYLGTLTFTGNGAIDSTQAVNVSLTVQPHCGLVTSTGYLTFTVIQGQNARANQSLNLNATASCAGTPLTWTSTSTEPWLITQTSGQLKSTDSTLVPVSVNAKSLTPGIYFGDLTFVSGQSTLTVTVKLNVQAHPSPTATAPIMGVSPLSLNFSNTQGQPSPAGQVVTITNTGKSPLKWTASPRPIVLYSWLGASPSGGTIAPGQSGQVTINVNTTNLTPGSYVGLVTLNGMDAKGNPAPGSPQTITVTLVIQPPCTIAPPSSSALSFSAVQGASTNPPSQTVLFTGTGNCTWPVTWTTSVTPVASWLTLTPNPSSGAVQSSGQSASIGVAPVNIASLPVGTYAAQVTISASDASGAVVSGSGQTVSVTLTVTGFTVSGTVFACPASTPPACATPQALPGATLTLTGGSTTLNATADGSGNYAIANVPHGTYTITVSGTDANSIHYVGTATVTVSGDTPNFTIQVFPG